MNTSENERSLTRKSDIIAYLPQDKGVNRESFRGEAESNGSNPALKKVHGRDESNQLRTPLTSGSKQEALNYAGRDEIASSIDSTSEVLKFTLSKFHNLKIGIVAMMILQIVGFAVQISFFGTFIKYTDRSCSFRYALGWIIDIFGAFGILFGFWGVLSYKIKSPNNLYQKVVVTGTTLAALYFVLIAIFAIIQSDDSISSCSKYKTNSLLSYTLLSSILVLTFVIQSTGILLLWKLIWEVEKIKKLEHSEQVRADLISKVADDLAVQ